MAGTGSLVDLTPVLSRKVAAVVGAFVADAATQPLHWIYKESVMASLTEGKDEIEFRNPSANPFYRLETGKNTCYGDQAYVMLKSLVESKGLNIPHLVEATYNYFGPESEYESDVTNAYQVGKEDKKNLKKTYPIIGPWRNGCIKEFLRNYQAKVDPTGSADDDQIDCAIRMIPLVALYAGQPNMLSMVESGLKVLQQSDMTIASALAMARILEYYILSGNPEEPLQKAINDIERADNPCPQELDTAVVGFIRTVIRVASEPHHVAVPKHFKTN